MSMRTTDEVNTCPYTGLRSFTEEESLYFKGRDLQVDQITALLEQNKFLMVTGASGEGKSSLIYAGLIPNARAGFFKARYSNWVIADFRPERTPVTNMAIALAEKFNSNPATVETELRRGYSSLIDLYTNSSFFLDEENAVQDISDQQAKDQRRKAANLLIIVDQFEEFFTNPENFFHETPSKDSQIVVNLILETARIAIKRNLPVYVVCTMRSDYIGQCSAFRGLPEYIGFSQFFVPRLKRKDLKQVIEEPALLSGIRISQRLIERLVFDIAEGVDQLPILQHALSRIWMAADMGNDELDLIHYAMVGGMPEGELPDEDLARFRKWFCELPLNHQGFYRDTGLSKIIEIHANILYENAWEYYNSRHPERPITQQAAKRIIAISFSCLTKIDNSRAVRNRMSLEEITGIINVQELSSKVIGEVLNIFREEGNSFIRPFKTEDPATHKLEPGTVLDITHESLIRNWNKLNQWANREFEFYSTFLDFQKQLNRWKNSGKSRGYLLPIGPLSYFENWYKNCKPNEGWIMRYVESREDSAIARRHATETLRDTREFLKRSSRKEFITRSFMKYGPQRIATVFAILVMLVLSGFYWYNADLKKNARVIEKIRSESIGLLKSEEAETEIKAIYLLIQERQDSGTLMPYLVSLDPNSKITLTNEVYNKILSFNKHNEDPLKTSTRTLLINNLMTPEKGLTPEFLMKERNRFLTLLAMDQYYSPESKKETNLTGMAEKSLNAAIQFFKDKGILHPGFSMELNLAIQMGLTFGKAKPDQLQTLLQLISPAAGTEAERAYDRYYMKGSLEPDGRQSMDFNGGYHTLACLYAAAGDIQHVLWCFEKLLETNQHDYFELPRIFNNHLNVLGYLYQYGHRDQVPLFLDWLAKHTADNPPVTILRNAILRAGYISHMYFINLNGRFFRSNRGYVFPNLCFSDRSVFDAMEEDYTSQVANMKDPAAKKFALALNQKRMAMFYSKYWYDRQMPADEQRLDQWLNQSLVLQGQLDSLYLEGTESSTVIYNSDGVRTSDVRRYDLLNYPDYRDGWFSWTFHTDYFFNLLVRKNLLKTIYKTGRDLQLLHYWVAKSFEWKTFTPPEDYSNTYVLPDTVLKTILAFVDQHPQGAAFDKNLLYLVLANRAFEKGDTADGLKFYQDLDMKNITRSSDRYEYLEKVFFLNMVKDLSVHLAAIGKTSDAFIMAGVFPTDELRLVCYENMADRVYNQHASPATFVFLDSIYSSGQRIDFTNLKLDFDCRSDQIRVLSKIGSRSLNESAVELLREIPQDFKFDGVTARVSGIASEGNYYNARTSIPPTLTESQDLICRAIILLEDCRAKERLNGNTYWKEFDRYLEWRNIYVNFNPN
jgi:energy-coupling factor transporter ATP-binding protein EcfA2